MPINVPRPDEQAPGDFGPDECVGLSDPQARGEDIADAAFPRVGCARSMKDVTTGNFGLFIAYVLPGFTALWGLSYVSEPVRAWLGTGTANAPTVGGFLYVTLASVAAGMITSTLRWLLIDTLHHWTGIRLPRWDFSRLQENVTAFDVLIEIHYRHYQFHANMLVALAFAYAARRLSLGLWSPWIGWLDGGFILLVVVLFLGSRDTLAKYYARTARLLSDDGVPTQTATRRTRLPRPPAEPSGRQPRDIPFVG